MRIMNTGDHSFLLIPIRLVKSYFYFFFCISWIFSKSISHEGSGARVVACFSQVSTSETVGSANDASFSAFTRPWSKAQIRTLINFSVFYSLQEVWQDQRGPFYDTCVIFRKCPYRS